MPKEIDPSSRDVRGAAPVRAVRGGAVRHLGWPEVACGATKERPSLAFALYYMCVNIYDSEQNIVHIFSWQGTIIF